MLFSHFSIPEESYHFIYCKYLKSCNKKKSIFEMLLLCKIKNSLYNTFSFFTL